MRFMTLFRKNLLPQAWRYKTSVFGGLMAIVSLSLAHYAGFLMKVPVQIVAVAGTSLAKGVTTTFLFYVFFCAVCARVATSIIQLFLLPLWALTDRFEQGFSRKMNWSRQRRFVRNHSRMIKWEGYAWLITQAFLFLFMMMALYVKFATTWISVFGLLIAILVVAMCGFLRAGFFFQLKPKIFTRKITSRPVHAGQAVSAAFVTATAALVIVAFFMGAMRASLLRNQNPQPIKTKDFAGMAAVIASSDGALLLFQKQDAEIRYIYSSEEFITSVESKPVFPPMVGRSQQ